MFSPLVALPSDVTESDRRATLHNIPSANVPAAMKKSGTNTADQVVAERIAEKLSVISD